MSWTAGRGDRRNLAAFHFEKEKPCWIRFSIRIVYRTCAGIVSPAAFFLRKTINKKEKKSYEKSPILIANHNDFMVKKNLYKIIFKKVPDSFKKRGLFTYFFHISPRHHHNAFRRHLYIPGASLQSKKDSCVAVFLGEGIFTMGLVKTIYNVLGGFYVLYNSMICAESVHKLYKI